MPSLLPDCKYRHHAISVFFKIVPEVSRIWKKLITVHVIVYILLLTPVTPEGGWDKCRINFHTLEISKFQYNLKKTNAELIFIPLKLPIQS